MKTKITLKHIIIITSALILIILSFVLNKSADKSQKLEHVVPETTLVLNTKEKEPLDSSFYIDIKGAVKKPGVYMFSGENKIIDAINVAGGLLKTATTSNINLSKKLKSEMVIYIFTKSELKTKTTETIIANNVPKCECEIIEVNNCIEIIEESIIDQSSSSDGDKQNNPNAEATSSIININLATMTELIELPGIGESKAKSIIQYRETKGLFSKIEDIKNVSGIGDTIYNSIKNRIKV